MIRSSYLYSEFLHKGLVSTLLCLLPLMVFAQSGTNPVPSRPTVDVSIPEMHRGTAKKMESSQKKIVAPKATKQVPMTQKYVQSGLMKVPVLNFKAKKRVPGKKVYERADVLSYDDLLHPEYHILSGNVRFKHEGATLFSDSAHFYAKTNSLYCFGNVHMEQGDTLFLYGAWLFYDGTNKLAQFREKVRMENRTITKKETKTVTLFTDSLNFDRVSNLGYFFDGGLLVDGTNELSSEYGQYNTETKIAHFKNDVKLVNPKFVLTNKELSYNTNTHIADINVPTDIYSDSTYIFTSKGNYNTQSDKSVLYNRSFVLSDHKRLTGDTVHYDSRSSIGEAFGNVVLMDTVQKITMIGGYGYSDETKGLGLMARQPLLIEHSSQDTLWLHGDTLKTTQDSLYKVVSAYHHVRFFRNDFQGMCDSLLYSTKDSILSFYNNPVLWAEKQQISGDFIQMHTKQNKPELLHIQKSAILIEQVSDSLFNQTSGKDLKAYFDSGQVVKVEIRGNAETVYLPLDEDNQVTGLNRLEGSSLDLYRANEKVQKIIVWPKPQGKFYPLTMLDSNARYLPNFGWYQEARPTSPEDIYRIYVIERKSKTKSMN